MKLYQENKHQPVGRAACRSCCRRRCSSCCTGCCPGSPHMSVRRGDRRRVVRVGRLVGRDLLPRLPQAVERALPEPRGQRPRCWRSARPVQAGHPAAVGRASSTASPTSSCVLVVGALSYYQQRQISARGRSDTPINRQQQMIMKILPSSSPLISLTLPAGLVVYFLVSNATGSPSRPTSPGASTGRGPERRRLRQRGEEGQAGAQADARGHEQAASPAQAPSPPPAPAEAAHARVGPRRPNGRRTADRPVRRVDLRRGRRRRRSSGEPDRWSGSRRPGSRSRRPRRPPSTSSGSTRTTPSSRCSRSPKPGLFGRMRGEARVRARVRPTRPRPKVERRDRRRRAPTGPRRPPDRRRPRHRSPRRSATSAGEGDVRRCERPPPRAAAGGAAGQEGAEGERAAERGQRSGRGPGPG